MAIHHMLDRVARTLFIGTTGVLTVFGVGLWALQRKLIYPASLPPGSRTDVWLPSKFGMEGEDLTLMTPDGVKIQSFLMLHPDGSKQRPTVLMLHANAGNNGHRLPIAKAFLRMGCNVMLPSYRGYGKSEGSPSEQGIKTDAQTALDYLLEHEKIGEKIILYGQSIGGAVAIDLAARNLDNIAGVAVENTFESLVRAFSSSDSRTQPRLVPSVMPAARPFVFLLSELWPSIDIVPKLTSTPVLFLSGARDEFVPPSHVQALYDACGSDRKTLRSFKDGDHNSTCMSPGYWQAVAEWIGREIIKEPSRFTSADEEAIEDAMMDEGADAGSLAPKL